MRADGLTITGRLDAILPLTALNTGVESPVIMMCASAGDQLDPAVARSCCEAINKHWPETPPIQCFKRFAFYESAKQAFAVVMTGETVKYGNMILKKGVPPTQKK